MDRMFPTEQSEEQLLEQLKKEFCSFDLSMPVDSPVFLSGKIYRTLKQVKPLPSSYLNALTAIFSFVDEVKRIVIKNRQFFDNQTYRDRQTYLHDIAKMHAFNVAGISELMTVSDWVEEKQLVEKLRLSYTRLSGVDRKNAITENIRRIEKRKRGGVFYRSISDELYNEGFSLAINGRDNTLFAAITHKYFQPQENQLVRPGKPFSWGPDPSGTIKDIIANIAGGYAEALHEEFLLKERKLLDAPPTDINADAKPVKLKWNGQPSELVEMFIQCKEQNALLNSHSELAAFLKNSVDIFEDWTVTEIIQLVGKEKKIII